MLKNFWQNRLIVSLTLIVVLLLLLISACNLIDLGGSQTPVPSAQPAILAPLENVKVLANAPVQIQSLQPGANISRVELLVQGPDSTTETLVRADKPTDGVVLQEWTPPQPGQYLLKVRTYDVNNVIIAELPRTINVVPAEAVSVAMVATPTPLPVPPLQPTSVLATPAPGAAANQAAGEFQSNQVAVIQMVATLPPSPTPSPTPFYPPPPPVPGVPPGPVQSPQLNVHPPVCDAAEYLGPYKGDTATRIFIPTDDMVPAQVTAATLVHRAWRLRNTGTCTWGPGYELAFYGGRSMGSGGAAFESIFPAEPGRRNTVVDGNRLIVPQGKPNQEAVVEVILTTPAIPGVHQSYWRMRNPQGVYFGPIIGVTMEVVRDCQPPPGGKIIYGAPTINYFRVLGINRVFEPGEVPVAAVTPVPATPIAPVFLAERGSQIVLDYWVIESQNIDIVIEDPVGQIERRAAVDPRDRAFFTPIRDGDYVVTLYADNGSCTVSQQIKFKVRPPTDAAVTGQFEITRLIFSESAWIKEDLPVVTKSAGIPADEMQISWQHPNPKVTQFRIQVLNPTIVSTGNFWCNSGLGIELGCQQEQFSPAGAPSAIISRAATEDTEMGITARDSFSRLCQEKYRQNPSAYPTGSFYIQVEALDAQRGDQQATTTVEVKCGLPSTTTNLPSEINQ